MLQKCIRLLILPLQRFQLLYAATLLILPLKRSCNPPGRCNATNAVTATPYATNAATATGAFLLLLQPLQQDACCCSCYCNTPVPAAPRRLLLLQPLQQACPCCSRTPAVCSCCCHKPVPAVDPAPQLLRLDHSTAPLLLLLQHRCWCYRNTAAAT